MRKRIKPPVFHGYPYKIGVAQRDTLIKMAEKDGAIEVSELVRFCIDEGIASIMKYGGLRTLMHQREVEKESQDVKALSPKGTAAFEGGKKERKKAS